MKINKMSQVFKRVKGTVDNYSLIMKNYMINNKLIIMNLLPGG